MTAIDLNDRALLQSLRADAEAQLACPGCSEVWADAYRDIARALDRLDAMWARVEIGQAHIVASQGLGEPIAATPAPAPAVKDSLTTAPAEPVAWVDERAIAWLQGRNPAAHITTPLQAGKSFERPMPLYAAPAAPAVQVVVERERVWIKRGVQSFMLAYEAETDAEREWFAGQLRAALSGFTPDVKTQAEARPADLAQTIRGITEAYRGTDCGKCAESIGDRLINVLAAPAAPAPEPLMTGYLVRNRNRVAEAVAVFGPAKDFGYLWSYMHGADDIEATEACAHLEVVRLYSAPVARKPYPSYAEEEATRKTQEAKPAPAVVAASMQELGQQSFMHLWMSYLDKKAEVEDLRERLAAAPAAPAPEPLTIPEVCDLVDEAGLDWQKGWPVSPSECNRFLQLATLVQKACLNKWGIAASKGEQARPSAD
jgi:hypothetical protein